MKRIKMVCGNCGSENILKDAYAIWSVESQEWELLAVYDNTRCEECGAEDSCEEKEIKDAAQNLIDAGGTESELKDIPRRRSEQ